MDAKIAFQEVLCSSWNKPHLASLSRASGVSLNASSAARLRGSYLTHTVHIAHPDRKTCLH